MEGLAGFPTLNQQATVLPKAIRDAAAFNGTALGGATEQRPRRRWRSTRSATIFRTRSEGLCRQIFPPESKTEIQGMSTRSSPPSQRRQALDWMAPSTKRRR
jgi:predicted metalloendopeptidase